MPNPSIEESRELRGRAILQLEGQITRLDDNTYKVKSQSGHGEYTLVQTELDSWICDCPDSTFRKIRCKHAFAVILSRKLRQKVESSVVLEPISVSVCPKCKSEAIVKHGIRHNRFGDIQRFSCKNCHLRFTVNLGFERMKHNPQVITSAMQFYFGGESLRHTQDALRLLGTQVSYQTIHNWISKYVSLMKSYLDKITPQVSDTWRTDEVYVKVRGNMKYLFAVMDDQTRFWIAQQVADHKGKSDLREMFHESKLRTGIKPKTIISDGAQNFAVAINSELANVHHIRQIALSGQRHNNKMEAMNGQTVRQREKVVRGLKSDESPVLSGLQIFHNYIRPHLALKGKTPSEMAGIKVNGENKWLTIIQNASRVPNFDTEKTKENVPKN